MLKSTFAKAISEEMGGEVFHPPKPIIIQIPKSNKNIQLQPIFNFDVSEAAEPSRNKRSAIYSPENLTPKQKKRTFSPIKSPSPRSDDDCNDDQEVEVIETEVIINDNQIIYDNNKVNQDMSEILSNIVDEIMFENVSMSGTECV